MIPDIERTIVALASGAQPAQRAIVRLTGPATASVLSGLLDLPSDSGPLAAQRLVAAEVHCALPEMARTLPLRLLYWPDGHSYTGQPSAELHMLGCLPLAEAVIARACQFGARPAERGEFTLRAFLAGKLDLAQAEAVLGVIEADSSESLQTALAQLGGNLAPAVRPLRESIVHIVAELEAGLDFVDEDIEFITPESVVAQLTAVRAALAQFATRLTTRSSSDIAPRVVLAGLPNSGKSSLFNALCGNELAIVTDQPGTTRDYLQRRIEVESTPIELIDTAGWEELQGDSPRALAQRQLLACLENADLCLLCVHCSDQFDISGLLAALQRIEHGPGLWLLVGTKLDLDPADERRLDALAQQLAERIALASEPIATSSVNRQGLGALRSAIAAAVSPASGECGPLAIVHQTAVRCRSATAAALQGIDRALRLAEEEGGEDWIAAELRLVLDELATIIGEVHSDDILGEIFSRFCIGK